MQTHTQEKTRIHNFHQKIFDVADIIFRKQLIEWLARIKLEICQKIYMNKFSAKLILYTEILTNHLSPLYILSWWQLPFLFCHLFVLITVRFLPFMITWKTLERANVIIAQSKRKMIIEKASPKELQILQKLLSYCLRGKIEITKGLKL